MSGPKPSSPDARQTPRAPIELKVDYKKLNSFFADYTKNISKGGTFIKTKKPLPVGTRFLFKLSVPGREAPFELLGEVVWSSTDGAEPGMGIRFIYASDSQRTDFEGLVEGLMADSLGPQLTDQLLHRSIKELIRARLVRSGRMAAVLLALGSARCAKEQDRRWSAATQAAADPTSQDYVSPPLRHARVSLPDAFGGQHLVDVELADSAPARQRGLMWRERLLDGQGMLFIFPTAEEHSFWMANTLIPLDLIFIDEAWKMVGVLEGVPPLSRVSRTVGVPSRYVLEVPGGWVAKTGVQPSSVLRAEGL